MTLAYFTSPTQQTNALRLEAPPMPRSRRWASKLGQAAWQLALRFGRRTTIHGLDRLLGARASRWERLVWLCTVICAFLGAVYVCLILSKRYNEGHFQTVVDSTRYPVYRLPFPVITICNQNRLNWQRIEAAKHQYMRNVTDATLLKLFERIVSAYDEMSFGNFQAFGALQDAPLASLSHINFSQVVTFMTWRCDEMLANCIWRHTVQNCCDVFSLRRSKNGLCWSFNSMETPEGRRMQLLDPFWPWRSGNAGPLSALGVRVLLHPEQQLPGIHNEKGVSVMVTEPFVWHKDPFIVADHTQTIVEIEPVIYFYDNDTRAISSDQRQCVFDDEHTSADFKSLLGYVYMIENCQSECHQEYLVRYCNCTMDLLFPPGQYRSCRAPDLPCLAEHNDYFRFSHQPGEEHFVRNNYEGMVCKCFRNCYSLNYIVDVRPSFLPSEVYGNVSYVDLDVHYRFETIMVYRTSLVFGWVDLMVSFGGIAGLFLGCSLISGMELAYFLCIEVPAFIVQGLLQQWRSRRLDHADTTPKHAFNLRQDVPSQLEQYIMAKQAAPTHHWPPMHRINFAHKHVINK